MHFTQNHSQATWSKGAPRVGQGKADLRVSMTQSTLDTRLEGAMATSHEAHLAN